ncbi:MAG: glycine cleavage system H protein, partial [Halothiobacillaceae bacterium]
MSYVPANFRYTESHEWAELLGDGTVRVGITDHAQDLLGDMVFVELPALGRRVVAKEECAVVESVKAASDIYSPIGGEVVEVNTALNDAPELVNKAPYGAGWLLRIKPENSNELEALLDSAAYSAVAE